MVPTVALPPVTPFTDQVTPAGASVTVADSWALVPVSSWAGAPEIATARYLGVQIEILNGVVIVRRQNEWDR